MPIKKENVNRYPKDWKQISERIRFERAKNKCEMCGVKNYSLIHYIDGKTIVEHEPPYNHPMGLTDYNAAIELKQHLNEWNDIYQLRIVVLTVAHLDHIPENCQDENLKAMCQKCHNNYDKKHRRETVLNSLHAGQVSLFNGL